MMLICAQGDDRPLPAHLNELEGLLGRPLPSDYRAFQEKYGALYIEVKEEVWPRAEAGVVGPFWTFNYGFAVLGLGHEVPDFLDVRYAMREMRHADPDRQSWLPVFRWFAGNGDCVCYDENDRLVEWRHDDEPQLLTMTLDEYLAEQSRSLVARRHEMIALQNARRKKK